MGAEQEHIVLSHMTAFRYWRLASAGLIAMPTRCRVNDLSQATSTLRNINPAHLAWRTITPAVLTEHGIVPRSALEPGLRLLASRGAIPAFKDLASAVDPSADTARCRRSILHELVRLLWSKTDSGLIGLQTAPERPDFSYSFPLPLDVLLGERGARCPSSTIRPHCHRQPLPRGALWRINQSVLIVSPAFLVAQLAGQCVGQPHIVIAGGVELAGTYSLLPPGYVDCGKLIDEGRDFIAKDGTLLGDGYAHSQPVLNPSLLSAALTPGCAGYSTAKAAGPYIISGSASPFETDTHTSLSPRYPLGGFSAGIPALNTPVHLSPEAQALYDNKQTCVPDALYSGRGRQRVDVEPGGDVWHSSSWKQDNKRRQALERDGYDVVAVSWDEFADFSRWSLIAESIVARLRFSREPPSTRNREKQALVHADLVNPDLLRDSFGLPAEE